MSQAVAEVPPRIDLVEVVQHEPNSPGDTPISQVNQTRPASLVTGRQLRNQLMNTTGLESQPQDIPSPHIGSGVRTPAQDPQTPTSAATPTHLIRNRLSATTIDNFTDPQETIDNLLRIHLFIAIASLMALLTLLLNLPFILFLICMFTAIVLDSVRTLRQFLNPSNTKLLKQELIERGFLSVTMFAVTLTFIVDTSFKYLSIVPYSIFFLYALYVHAEAAFREMEPQLLVGVVIRGYFLSELALILLKIDHHLNQSWYLIFAMEWLQLMVTIFFGIGTLINLSCNVCNPIHTGEAHKIQMKGLLFVFGDMVFLSIFQFYTYGGYVKFMEYGPEDSGLFEEGLLIGVVGALIMVGGVYYWRNALMAYVEAMNAEAVRLSLRMQSYGAKRSEKKRRAFKISKAEGALQKFSSTYFQFLKGVDLQKQPHLNKLAEEDEATPDSPDVTPKQRANLERSSQQRKSDPENKQVRMNSSHCNGTSREKELKIQVNMSMDHKEMQEHIANQLTSERKRYKIEGKEAERIVNNQVGLGSPPGVRKSTDPDEKSNSNCIVCFDGNPDSVMMPCGHGGLCYDCAKDIWVKTNSCFLCRQAIDEILQIDHSTLKGKGPIQVCGSTKMVLIGEKSFDNLQMAANP